MFAKRNSLTLAILWVVLLVGGLFWYFSEAGRLVEAREEHQRLLKQLEDSRSEIRKFAQVEQTYNNLQDAWLNTPKKIISADEPSFSLSYVNWIMTSNYLEIDFDFVLNSKQPLKNYTRFVYTLSGEGTYSDIYQLIWHLTYEPILYKINAITLRRKTADSDLLSFNIKLEGYTAENQVQMVEDFSQWRLASHETIAGPRDIFEPLIRPRPVVKERPAAPSKPKLPPKKPGEIDVEKATLQAVTNNSIFIREGNGKMVELKLGDPVYLGRLVRINQETNQAEFEITKFGRTERIVLGIDFKK